MPKLADKAMLEVFGAVYVSLHVRVTNKAAYHLYTVKLGYQCAFYKSHLFLSTIPYEMIFELVWVYVTPTILEAFRRQTLYLTAAGYKTQRQATMQTARMHMTCGCI